MHCSPARWKTVVAAAALSALPVAGYAQTPPPATPPAQPAPQTQPAQPQQTTTAQPAKVDATAAKEHLSQARDTLSQLTALPEAARLQGDTRTQVSQLISNFNELITTQSDWRAAYAKLDANLTTLLGPESADQPQTPPPAGVAGAVGTSGAGAAQIDPAIRTKLAEFRTHLKAFERAAGTTSGAMAPSPATGTTMNPANPAAPTNPVGAANPAGAPAPATPPSAVTPDSPTTAATPADQAKASEQAGHSEADKHLDAISAILDKSTGTLTKAQTAELKKHVAELRQLLQKSK